MMQQGIMSKLDQLRQGGGAAPMAGPAPMPPTAPSPELMQDQAPEMVAERPEPVDAGQDAQNLASAVIQRSQGDPQLALNIIDGAKGIIMQSIEGSQREPQMMEDGGPLRPIPEGNKGLQKLDVGVRNQMGFMADGGDVNARANYLRNIT